MRNQDSESNNAAATQTETASTDSIVPIAVAKKIRSGWLKRVALLLVASGVIWLAVFLATPYTPSPIEPARNYAVKIETAKPESIESQLLGTWEDNYHGKRTLTLRPDGTGTMVCELAGWEASVFAKMLTFEEAWFVADGSLTMRVTGGEPKAKIDFVLKMEGDTTTQKIVELTPNRLLVFDAKGSQQFDWRRVRSLGDEPAKVDSPPPVDSSKSGDPK